MAINLIPVISVVMDSRQCLQVKISCCLCGIFWPEKWRMHAPLTQPGDVIHSPLELHDPGWIYWADTFDSPGREVFDRCQEFVTIRLDHPNG